MPIWQLCANLLIPNCLRSNLSYSPLAALELYVNFAKPKFGELQFKDGYKLPFYMIHHTSMLYSPQLWHDFLNKEIPEVVSFLDK